MPTVSLPPQTNVVIVAWDSVPDAAAAEITSSTTIAIPDGYQGGTLDIQFTGATAGVTDFTVDVPDSATNLIIGFGPTVHVILSRDFSVIPGPSKPLTCPAFYMEIDVNLAAGGTLNLFVFEVDALDLTAGSTGYTFRGVTSMLDFLSLPAVPIAPLSTSSTLQAFYRSQTERDFVWSEIQKDVSSFLSVLNSNLV